MLGYVLGDTGGIGREDGVEVGTRREQKPVGPGSRWVGGEGRGNQVRSKLLEVFLGETVAPTLRWAWVSAGL